MIRKKLCLQDRAAVRSGAEIGLQSAVFPRVSHHKILAAYRREDRFVGRCPLLNVEIQIRG